MGGVPNPHHFFFTQESFDFLQSLILDQKKLSYSP